MKQIVTASLAVVLAIGVSLSARADEGEAYTDGQKGGNWQDFKKDMKEAGHNIGETGKEIGLGVADGAKKGSKAVKEFFTPDAGNGKGNSKDSNDSTSK
jgi:hypothetical protein